MYSSLLAPGVGGVGGVGAAGLGGMNTDGGDGAETMITTTTVEVPLAFHTASSGRGGPVRLLLDDESMTASPTSPAAGSAEGSAMAADAKYLRGMASAECHPNVLSDASKSSASSSSARGRSKVMITTAADPDCPSVLIVTALPFGGAADGNGATASETHKPSKIELDLSALCQFNHHHPIKVKTFLHPGLPEDAYLSFSSSTTSGNNGDNVDVGDDMRQSMVRYDDDNVRFDDDGGAYDMGNYGRPTGYGGMSSIGTNGSGGPVVRLVMIDTAGTILTLFLSYVDGMLAPLPTASASTSTNIRTMHMNSIPDLIAATAPHLYLTPGTALSSTDVDFLTPTRLVVALAPHLLCVDLINGGGRSSGNGSGGNGGGNGSTTSMARGRVVTWTMNVGRRSTFRGILSQAGCMLVGKEIDEDEYVDDVAGGADGRGGGRGGGDDDDGMAPVSALTVVRHSTLDEEAKDTRHFDDTISSTTSVTVVFTLHSDGTIRLWYVGTKPSLQPKKVRLLRVPGEIGSASAALEGSDSVLNLPSFLSSARKSKRSSTSTGTAAAVSATGRKIRWPGEDPPLPEATNWSSDTDAIMLRGELSYDTAASGGAGKLDKAAAAADDGELRYALAISVRTIEDPLAEIELAEQQAAASAAATTVGGGSYAGGVTNPTSRVRSPSLSSTGIGIGSPNHHANRSHSVSNAAPTPRPSPVHVLIMSGNADGKKGLTGTDGAVPLIVPSEARNVVDLGFVSDDTNRDGCVGSELHALFATGDGEESRHFHSFAGTDDDDTVAVNPTGSIFAVYPPSNSTVISHSSLLVGATSNVDVTAQAERYSILALKRGLKTDIAEGCDSIDEITELIDRACMTNLFRPTASRSVGGTHANPAAICRAIRKLIPSYDVGTTSKVEVDALLAVREWTRSDEAKRVLLSVSAGHDASADEIEEDSALNQSDIYRAFAAKTPSKNKGRGGPGEEGKIDEAYERENEGVRRAEAHLSRWIKLLLAVLDDEETIRREVLCLASTSSMSSAAAHSCDTPTEVAVTVRGGLTSAVVARISSSASNTVCAQLDALSVDLLRHLRISASKHLSERLCNDIHRITGTVAKADLVMSKLDQDIVDSLAFLGSSAMKATGSRSHPGGYGYNLSPTGDTTASSTLIATVTSLLDALSAEEITLWLSPSSAGDSATVCPFLLGGAGTGSASELSIPSSESSETSVASASYLAKLHIDSVRELCLARCLLVLGTDRLVSAAAESSKAATAMMGRTADTIISGGSGGGTGAVSGSIPNEALVNDALRAYLRATAVQFAQAQKLDAASSPPSTSRDDVPSSSRPRMSGALDSSEASAGVEHFSVVEAVCLSIAKSQHEQSGEYELASSAVAVAKQFVAMSFSAASAAADDVGSSIYQISMLGPFTNQARIALRLLATDIAYPDAYVSYESSQMTAKAASEYLLIEATFAEQNNTMSAERILSLRERASEILRSSCSSIEAMVDLTTVCNVLKKLHDLTEDYAMTSIVSLEALLQKILRQPIETLISKDIKDLCSMQTTKGLFLPWLEQASLVGNVWGLIEQHYPPDFASDVEADVTTLCQALLCISDLIQRVKVLERHCSIASGSSVVLRAIKDVITEIDGLLPRAMAEEYMPEYPTLMSSAFQNAMLGRNWDEAYAACVDNPMKERRVACFRRLVIGMADAGAVQELIEMPLTVIGKPTGPNADVTMSSADDVEQSSIGKSSAEEIDIYELAAETLADAALEQYRNSSALRADYRGCLYSLHASRANWRRAGAAIAFGGSLARSKAATADSDLSTEESRAIIDAVTLAALGAAHSIQLEENPSHRFIVANELGQYPANPLLCEGMDNAASLTGSNKRRRDGQQRQLPLFGQDQTQQSTSSVNRSALLQRETDLIAQAIESVGLRTRLLDQSKAEASVVKALKATSIEIAEELASQGYYSLALDLAKTVYDKRNGARPEGRDIFIGAVSYVILRHILPTAIRCSRPTPTNASDGSEWEARIVEKDIMRPTLAQIHSSFENMDPASHTAPSNGTDGWKTQDTQLMSAHGAACMDLLRAFTTKYANSTNKLAVEVAETLLDLDNCMAALPIWLTDLLCGTSSGCFAGVAKETSESVAADPTALVKLYMKHGLYAQACKVVVTVLDKTGKDGSSAARRLPEEGQIDFVPYSTIDQLWNIIESAAHGMKPDERDGIMQARDDMEVALEEHMKRLKISQDGLVSARALK